MYKFRKRIVVFVAASAVCAASLNVYAAEDSQNLLGTDAETAAEQGEKPAQESDNGQESVDTEAVNDSGNACFGEGKY